MFLLTVHHIALSCIQYARVYAQDERLLQRWLLKSAAAPANDARIPEQGRHCARPLKEPLPPLIGYALPLPACLVLGCLGTSKRPPSNGERPCCHSCSRYLKHPPPRSLSNDSASGHLGSCLLCHHVRTPERDHFINIVFTNYYARPAVILVTAAIWFARHSPDTSIEPPCSAHSSL